MVYGDVGTSPLYVFSSTFTENIPTETDVLGAMSIIFWTITLVLVVKYMLIVLMADDNGEGKPHIDLTPPARANLLSDTHLLLLYQAAPSPYTH